MDRRLPDGGLADGGLLALTLVLSLKASSAPVPKAKPVGVTMPMEVDTDGVVNSNPGTSLLAPARLGHEGLGLNSSRPSGGAASPYRAAAEVG